MLLWCNGYDGYDGNFGNFGHSSIGQMRKRHLHIYDTHTILLSCLLDLAIDVAVDIAAHLK